MFVFRKKVIIYKNPNTSCPYSSPPENRGEFFSCVSDLICNGGTLDGWIISCDGCKIPLLAEKLENTEWEVNGDV